MNSTKEHVSDIIASLEIELAIAKLKLEQAIEISVKIIPLKWTKCNVTFPFILTAGTYKGISAYKIIQFTPYRHAPFRGASGEWTLYILGIYKGSYSSIEEAKQIAYQDYIGRVRSVVRNLDES